MEQTTSSVIQVIEDLGMGGMERVVQACALTARSAGIQSRVLCTRGGGPVADELKRAGIRVDVIDGGGVLRAARALKAQEKLLVHSHGAVRTTARLAGRLAGAAGIVHHLHGTERLGLKQRLYERTLRPDLYIACSGLVRDDFERQVGASDVEVLYNAVDAGRFRFSESPRRHCRAELGAKEGAAIVACVGRFVPDKGHRFVIQAARRILSVHPDALFVFIGDGPGRAEVERSAAALGKSARFAGIRADVVPFLCACDIYVQPSVNREGLTVSVLEALSCERVVVGSSLPGLQETIGDAGLLVPPGDPEALAATLLRLIGDAKLRAELGQRGRERVLARFSGAEYARKLIDIYRRLLEAR